jgi:hypothetical protein
VREGQCHSVGPSPKAKQNASRLTSGFSAKSGRLPLLLSPYVGSTEQETHLVSFQWSASRNVAQCRQQRAGSPYCDEHHAQCYLPRGSRAEAAAIAEDKAYVDWVERQEDAAWRTQASSHFECFEPPPDRSSTDRLAPIKSGSTLDDPTASSSGGLQKNLTLLAPVPRRMSA